MEYVRVLETGGRAIRLYGGKRQRRPHQTGDSAEILLACSTASYSDVL